MRVALTRPAGSNDEWRRLLESDGHDVVELSLTSVGTIASSAGALSDALIDASNATVFFTSANGVRSAAALYPAIDDVLRDALQVVAIGSVTRDALRSLGVEGVWVPSAANSETLLDELVFVPGRALVIGAKQMHPRLVDGLESLGWDVAVVAVYETVAITLSVEEVAQLMSADVIALAAPSAVAALVESVPTSMRAQVPQVLSIGPTTRTAVDAVGWLREAPEDLDLGWHAI
jgi:uroporphyrinogen-III synthase